MSGRALAAVAGLTLLLSSGCASEPLQANDPVLIKLEAQISSGDVYDARWKAAKACVALVESPQVTRKLDYAQRGLKHAEAAIALSPRKVEGHYYRALTLGYVLKNSTLPTRGKMLELEKSGKEARRIDPSFQSGGPLRFLALLYQEAPAFPLGPVMARDEEVIEDLFLKSIKVAPHHTENQIYYAEFLVSEERDDEAVAMAKRAKTSLTEQTELPKAERKDLARRIEAILTTGKVAQASD